MRPSNDLLFQLTLLYGADKNFGHFGFTLLLTSPSRVIWGGVGGIIHLTPPHPEKSIPFGWFSFWKLFHNIKYFDEICCTYSRLDLSKEKMKIPCINVCV